MLKPGIWTGFVFDSLDKFNPYDHDLEDVPEVTGIIKGKSASFSCTTGKVKLHI